MVLRAVVPLLLLQEPLEALPAAVAVVVGMLPAAVTAALWRGVPPQVVPLLAALLTAAAALRMPALPVPRTTLATRRLSPQPLSILLVLLPPFILQSGQLTPTRGLQHHH